QRFDLRRVDADILAAHLAEVAEKEGVRLNDGAKALLARAADGSVRDGLSLLDQAIVQGGGEIDEARIRDMLGLADRGRVIDLFEATMKGAVAEALDIFADLYRSGADPVVVIGDLLDFTHWLTRLKVAPKAAQSQPVAEAERVRGGEMAAKLSMPALTRAWQMLLKGLGETRVAPAPPQAAEMLLVRLAHAADLPAPAEIVAQLRSDRSQSEGGATAPAPAPAPVASPAAASPLSPSSGADAPPAPDRPTMYSVAGGAETRAALAEAPPAPDTAVLPEAEAALPPPESFAAMAQLFADRREPLLYAHLTNDVHPVHFEPGRIEFAPGPYAPTNLASRVGTLLAEWTGQRWVVSLSREPGAKTLNEQAADAEHRSLEEAAADPAISAVLDAFPGATIVEVRDLGPEMDEDVEMIENADGAAGLDAPPSDGELEE
ncbi:MAG: DNA polymerase III subunit gamma/tau, partial [Alphaproteobacteria bacterium]